MTSDEVEALCGPLTRALVQIRTSTDSACERSDHARVAAPEAAHIVTETTVPFRPARGRKISYLIGTTCIPSFCDYLYITQDRILGDAFKKRGLAQNISV